MSPQTINRSQTVLDAQVAAAEHIRACGACRHLFEIAYQEMNRLAVGNYAEMVVGPNPFEVTVQICANCAPARTGQNQFRPACQSRFQTEPRMALSPTVGSPLITLACRWRWLEPN
jgi:hypothetical protein